MTHEPRHWLRIGLALALSALLSACVTVRLHARDELAAIGRSCGLAEGELIQEPEEPRVLFFYAIGPTKPQIACVARWARKHHLHLAYIQAVNWQDSNAPQN